MIGSNQTQQRGFALLIAIVLSAVAAGITLALTSLAYKNLILSSGSQQSQYAFYAADTALECALYWDAGTRAKFPYVPSGNTTSGISCAGVSVNSGGQPAGVMVGVPNGAYTVYTSDWFSIDSGARCGQFIIYKKSTGNGELYANGVNTSCAAMGTDPRAIERSIKALY